MYYALAAAALIAGVVAVPLNNRDVVVETDVVYETQYVTITAGQEPAYTSTAEPETTTSVTTAAHYGHHSHNWPSSWTVQSTSTSVYVAPSSTYVAPAPETTSTYVAPAPTSAYVAPAPSTTEAASYSAPASSAAASPSDYPGKVVLHHNLHRANHSASALEWSDSLASTASKIAASCIYAHNVGMDGGGYGQNIAAGVKADDITSVITDLFYNGEVSWYDNLYGQAQPDMTNFESWGHFSQIVWKKTTSVGCATQDCSSQGLVDSKGHSMPNVSPYFTVCNYESPGNYANEYADNVGASLMKATIEAAYGL